MKDIAELKKKYVEYYETTPVQRYAAMYVGRDEDTILRWKKEDAEFAEAVNLAKAKWVSSRLKDVKSEFALERLEKQIFSQKQEHEHTGEVVVRLGEDS